MTIVITSGDPAGIGPEIVQKAWICLKKNPTNEFFWIGDPLHLPDSNIPWQRIEHPNQASKVFGDALPILIHKFAHPIKVGQHQPENAADVINVIKKAVNLVKTDRKSVV